MSNLPPYDQRAFDIARAMVEIISPEDAFLFGSRTRGDWNDTSDIALPTYQPPGARKTPDLTQFEHVEDQQQT